MASAIRTGDRILCEGCNQPRHVTTYYWDEDLHVIECRGCIRLVGLNGRRTRQRCLFDWGQTHRDDAFPTSR
jgi:hypothetical protein